VFLVYFLIRIGEPKCTFIYEGHKADNWEKAIVILNVLIVVQMMMKTLFLMQSTSTFGLLTTLVIEVMKAVVPFLSYFFLWVLFFAVISIILGGNLGNAQGYKGLTLGLGYFLNTFENGLGNINPPTIDFSQGKDEDKFNDVLVYLIYLFWFGAQIFLLVVLLNFVIALISQYYENVMNLANMHTYVMKQALNSECDVFYEYFCKKGDDPKIDAVILIDAAAHEDDGEWKGLTQVIKTFIS